MAERWLILADDLTGAADCGIAFARRGFDATVSWDKGFGLVDKTAPVLSFDTGSRSMVVDAAVGIQHAALEKLLTDDRLLFKKIDSTLRGHPAAEIAAVSAHLKDRRGTGFGVFAPAFPATKRTTIDGRVYVGGRRLEETETWQRDHSCPSGRLDEVLGTIGVVGHKVALATIRGDTDALTRTFAWIAAEDGVLAICDAETDGDLRRIAAAGLRVSPRSFFIGSAGLAHAVAAIGPQAVIEHRPIATSARGALIVVGSLAENSRAAADALASYDGVVHLSVDPQLVLSDADGRAELGQRVANLLDAGADVLIAIAKSAELNLSFGPRLIAGLAQALEPATEKMGGFAATGGETAAAMLSRCGVNGIRLVDEIEPGVALGFSLGELSIPVATKAGAFGDRLSLTRIVDRLRHIRRKGTFT